MGKKRSATGLQALPQIAANTGLSAVVQSVVPAKLSATMTLTVFSPEDAETGTTPGPPAVAALQTAPVSPVSALPTISAAEDPPPSVLISPLDSIAGAADPSSENVATLAQVQAGGTASTGQPTENAAPHNVIFDLDSVPSLSESDLASANPSSPTDAIVSAPQVHPAPGVSTINGAATNTNGPTAQNAAGAPDATSSTVALKQMVRADGQVSTNNAATVQGLIIARHEVQHEQEQPIAAVSAIHELTQATVSASATPTNASPPDLTPQLGNSVAANLDTNHIVGARSAPSTKSAPDTATQPVMTDQSQPIKATSATSSERSDGSAITDQNPAQITPPQPVAANAQPNLALNADPNAAVPARLPSSDALSAGTTRASTVLAQPPEPDVAPAAEANSVRIAQMVDRGGQSEMRVGLNTEAFGNVEILTTVRASSVGLVVGSERGDLHSLLSAELPAITHNLEQHSIRLQTVSFEQRPAFSAHAGSGDSQRQPVPRNFRGSSASPSLSLTEQISDTSSRLPTVAGGLSILA